jgi:hypothetical protein
VLPRLQAQGQPVAQVLPASPCRAAPRSRCPLGLCGRAAVLAAEALRGVDQRLPVLDKASQPPLLLRGQQRALAYVLQQAGEQAGGRNGARVSAPEAGSAKA